MEELPIGMELFDIEPLDIDFFDIPDFLLDECFMVLWCMEPLPEVEPLMPDELPIDPELIEPDEPEPIEPLA